MRFIVSASVAVAVLLAGVQQAAAVCAPGQMAVGRTFYSVLEGTNDIEYYSGFEMTNNCGLISQNGLTQDPEQMCYGGYTNGASVQCSGGWPVSAIDTGGTRWNCYSTSDRSCNGGSPILSYEVLACCNRA